MLRALFESRSSDDLEARAGWEWFASGGPFGGTPTWAGQSVTRESSQQLMAVYGSVRLISEQIATLPIDVYRRSADMETTTHLPTPTWIEQPTVALDSVEWRSQVLTSLLLDGNAYLLVVRDDRGNIVEVPVFDPSVVDVRRSGTRLVYVIEGTERRDWEILHLRAMMMPGSAKGVNPIEHARQTIGLGLAALQYGAEFFTNEGNMPGVIELSKPTQPQVMREAALLWQRRRRQGGRGMPGIIPDGGTWKPTSINHEQAEFLATRKWTAAEIAAQLYLVDPSDLGIPTDGSSLTYANLEQRNARRVQVTLLPWIVRLERALSLLLPRGQYVKLNVNGLLRGDLKTRWETYDLAEKINSSAAQRGDTPVMSTQEMRDLEDLGPAPESPEPPESPAPPAPTLPEVPTDAG